MGPAPCSATVPTCVGTSTSIHVPASGWLVIWRLGREMRALPVTRVTGPRNLGPVDVDLRKHRVTDGIEQVLEPGPAIDHRGQLELVVVVPDGDATRRGVLLRLQQIRRETADRGQVGETLRWCSRDHERVYAQLGQPIEDLRSRLHRWGAADGRRCPRGPGPAPNRARSADRCRAGLRTRRRRSPHEPRVPAQTGSPARPHHGASRAGARWGWGWACA